MDNVFNVIIDFGVKIVLGFVLRVVIYVKEKQDIVEIVILDIFIMGGCVCNVQLGFMGNGVFCFVD